MSAVRFAPLSADDDRPATLPPPWAPRTAPPPTPSRVRPSLPGLAREAGERLDALVSYFAASYTLASNAALVAARALRAWDAACIAEVGYHPTSILPAWPRWRNATHHHPAQLAALVAALQGDPSDAATVSDLAAECRRWANERDAQEGDP